MGRSSFWRDLTQALGVAVTVVAFGVAWAQVETGIRAPYHGPAMDQRLRPGPGPSLWLVDGFNVLHAVVLGGRDRAEWWKEPRRSEVLELAGALSGRGADVWVVFDGPPERCGESVGPEGVHEVFAPSADEWLVERVKASRDPSRVAVVTADRALVERLELCRARVVAPADFAERCRAPEQTGG